MHLWVQCVSILWQVDELDNAVRMSERDPARFRLTSEEVAERRRWVEATRTGAQGDTAGCCAHIACFIAFTVSPVGTTSNAVPLWSPKRLIRPSEQPKRGFCPTVDGAEALAGSVEQQQRRSPSSPADMQKRLLEARSNARKAGDVEMGDMSDPAAWLRREKNSENDSFIASQVCLALSSGQLLSSLRRLISLGGRLGNAGAFTAGLPRASLRGPVDVRRTTLGVHKTSTLVGGPVAVIPKHGGCASIAMGRMGVCVQDQGQQLMLQRQDEDLEAMSQQVGRIGEIGLAIGQELKEQR